MSRDMTKPTNECAPSLIRVFAVRMKKPWVLSNPLSAQWRLWSDWADWADLSLRWAHTHFVGFVISRLIYLPTRGHNPSTATLFMKPMIQLSLIIRVSSCPNRIIYDVNKWNRGQIAEPWWRDFIVSGSVSERRSRFKYLNVRVPVRARIQLRECVIGHFCP